MKKKKHFRIRKQVITRIQFVLDSAEALKNSFESLQAVSLQLEASLSIDEDDPIDLDEICQELKQVLDLALIVKSDVCGAVDLIDEDLQDCLEAQEEPPELPPPMEDMEDVE